MSSNSPDKHPPVDSCHTFLDQSLLTCKFDSPTQPYRVQLRSFYQSPCVNVHSITTTPVCWLFRYSFVITSAGVALQQSDHFRSHGIPVTGTRYSGNATRPLHSFCFPFGHGNQHRLMTRSVDTYVSYYADAGSLALLSDSAVARISDQGDTCYIQRNHCRGPAYVCAYSAQTHSPEYLGLGAVC
jgi:hypothetical protein